MRLSFLFWGFIIVEIKVAKQKTKQCLKTSIDRYQIFIEGFTLIEIMIVVVLVGVIAAFGIPTFDKMIRKSHERNAILGLTLINKANEVYEARTGGYYNSGGAVDLAAINTNLSIDVKALDLTYSYTGVAGSYTATAAWTGSNPFTVEVDQGPISFGTNPSPASIPQIRNYHMW